MRVFVAISPPDEVRKRIYAAARELRDAPYPIRWIPPGSIHLTLQFLGQVGDERIDGIVGALWGAVGGAGAFEVRVSGFGAFPSPGWPNVVWVGADGGDRLAETHREVQTALAELGFAREKRSFHPHLTLGRARRGARPREFQGLGEAFGRLSCETSFPARAVDVMRSTLKPTGAEYDSVQRVEL